MGLTDTYTLEGRAIHTDADGIDHGPCIFCGTPLVHVNDGGDGWILGAVTAAGTVDYFFYCNSYCAPLAGADAELHIQIDTPEKDRILFRCGCSPDYVESVGSCCHECRASRDDLVPVPQ